MTVAKSDGVSAEVLRKAQVSDFERSSIMPVILVIAAADASDVNKRKADRVLLPGQTLNDVLTVVLAESDDVKQMTFRLETS